MGRGAVRERLEGKIHAKERERERESLGRRVRVAFALRGLMGVNANDEKEEGACERLVAVASSFQRWA